MVYKIIDNRFRIFVESFFIALVIFLIGFSIGFYFESFRTSSIIKNYNENEIHLLDFKLQNYYYQIMGKNFCDAAIQQNFKFADEIYNEGLKLERYEEANQLSDEILTEKKKYVLLKTELWLNTILLRKKCNRHFDTIVYFYSSDPSNTLKVAQQKMISNILKEIKHKRGNSIVLIPIAGDLNLGIIDLQMKSYNVTSLPSILINEKTVMEGFHSEKEIEKLLDE